jgi:hypothetical protein
MKVIASLSLLFFAHSARGHGDHGHTEPVKGETIQQYAQRHMTSEHHIDSFDIRSFFQLHDLNRDGFWDREEIEAIYGVHHVYSQKKSKDDVEHQKKADHIASTVLNLLDKNEDGKVTPEEFEAVGLEGLPSFDDMGAEGHHYDIESEFFLHHEEQFHSSPETQTDDSYTHPEDLEHFAHHESIERQEAEKEAKFQGVSVEEVIKSHEHDGEARPPPSIPNVDGQAASVPPVAEQTHDDQAGQAPLAGRPSPARPTFPRPREMQDPAVRFQNLVKEGKSEWGSGEEGYKPPKSPSDKMRKNLPYKYKFRRNWGDF